MNEEKIVVKGFRRLDQIILIIWPVLDSPYGPLDEDFTTNPPTLDKRMELVTTPLYFIVHP